MRACLAGPCEDSVFGGSKATDFCTSLACAASIVCSEHSDHIDNSHTVWKCPIPWEESCEYEEACSMVWRILLRENVRSLLSEDRYDWEAILRAMITDAYNDLQSVREELAKAYPIGSDPKSNKLLSTARIFKFCAARLLSSYLVEALYSDIWIKNANNVVDPSRFKGRFEYHLDGLNRVVQSITPDLIKNKKECDFLIFHYNNCVVQMLRGILANIVGGDCPQLQGDLSLYSEESEKINKQLRQTCKLSLVTAVPESARKFSLRESYIHAEARRLARQQLFEDASDRLNSNPFKSRGEYDSKNEDADLSNPPQRYSTADLSWLERLVNQDQWVPSMAEDLLAEALNPPEGTRGKMKRTIMDAGLGESSQDVHVEGKRKTSTDKKLEEPDISDNTPPGNHH